MFTAHVYQLRTFRLNLRQTIDAEEATVTATRETATKPKVETAKKVITQKPITVTLAKKNELILLFFCPPQKNMSSRKQTLIAVLKELRFVKDVALIAVSSVNTSNNRFKHCIRCIEKNQPDSSWCTFLF